MDGQKENRQTNHNKGETPQQSRANKIECYEGPQNTCVHYMGSVVGLIAIAVLWLVGWAGLIFQFCKKKVSKLENTLDDEDAYVRRETIIFNGSAIPPSQSGEICNNEIRKVIKEKLKI